MAPEPAPLPRRRTGRNARWQIERAAEEEGPPLRRLQEATLNMAGGWHVAKDSAPFQNKVAGKGSKTQ